MSAAETLYTPRIPYPDVLERGRQQVVSLPVYRDGALAAPSDGTFSLYDPSGLVITTGSVTIASSTASYTLTTTHLATTLALGEGYQEVWALVMPDTATHTFRRTAAVARRLLYPVYSDVDALAEYPSMTRDLGPSATSLQGQLDEAWRQILGWLAERRAYPYLVLTSDSFRDLHRHITLSLWFKSAFRGSTAGPDRWEALWKHHQAEAEKARLSLTMQIDRDHDGFAENESREKAATVTHLNASGSQRAFYRIHPL